MFLLGVNAVLNTPFKPSDAKKHLEWSGIKQMPN